ncbi:MAG: hypothetical protein N4A74_00625 [Carboxylicivirga sp.]|jgi:hypothetical protein|nr:hypothetical protein [Carboxylicivirga sp.]
MRLLFAILFVSIALFSKAQDAHYWTEQYGTRSMLLSNSVFGSVEDLGAVFYNPARLSVIEDNAFLISGKVYQLSSYSFDTDSDDGRTSPKSQSSFGGAPSLLAGTYRIKGWDKHTFAYSFLGRRNMDIEIKESSSIYGNALPSIPGDEYFSGDMRVEKAFNEEWFGASWSYAPNSKFSFGVSNFLTVRKQNAVDQLFLQAYTEAEDVEVFNRNNSYNYSHLGLLWKLGFSYSQPSFSCGLTITTPTVSLSGDGAFGYDRIYTGINDENPIYERDNQSGLKMKYKTPFAIGGGAGYKFKRGSIHVSAEYFGAIKEYTLMQNEPFKGQSTDIEYQSSLIDELNSVLNFGIGYNFVFSEQVYGYVSYSTDFSAAVGSNNNDEAFNTRTYASTFNSDINHFGGGVVLKLKRLDLTLGASLATTKYSLDRPLGFPTVDGASLFNETAKTDIRWNRWRFIVGISIPFLNDFAKKWEDKLLNGVGASDKKN